MTDSAAATCPTCGSPSIQAVPIQRKKLSDPGLVEALLQTEDRAAETETVIQAVCLKCGAAWFPGTKDEQEMRAMSGQLGEQAKAEMQQVVATRQRDQAGLQRATFWVVALLVIGAIVYWILTH